MFPKIFLPMATAVFLLTVLIILTSHTHAGASNPVLIDAVYYDTYESGEPDEAVRIINITSNLVDISGWSLTDNSSTSILPTATIPAQETRWLAKNRESFYKQFGFYPDYFTSSSDITPNLSGTWPGFRESARTG